MKTSKIISVMIAAVLTGSALTACGKTSPQLPSNLVNPVGNNPYDPSNPANNGSGVTSPISGMGSVVGRVVDSTGKGLANVLITIKNVTATSTITGDFQLNNVEAGAQVMQLRYGNRQLSINVNVTADTSVTPDINPVQFSNNGTNGSGLANNQLKTFKVDQDFFNQWQAKGISVSGGSIYLAVADNTSLFKKGSIISMSTEDGKTWKDIGSKWLGLRFPLDKTISGIAVNGTTLMAVDTKGSMYSVENKKTVKAIKSGPGVDVAVGAGVVYIATGSSVEKTDITGQSRAPISGLSATGGICTDSQGNLYAVSGNTIKKVDSSKTVSDVVTDGITGAIDVAVDDKSGFIYVLETSQIKRFSITGVLLATFGTGAVKATSIATDELGNVYVADEGKDYKTSKVVKFGPASGAIPNYQNSDAIKAASVSSPDFDGTSEGTTSEDSM